MKSPHNQQPDDAARLATEAFIEKHARLGKAAKQTKGGERAATSEEQVSA